MAIIRSFRGFRPPKELAARVASKPYDVLDSEEARREAAGNPVSFYRINKPEIDLPPETDVYSDEVYATGKKNLDEFIAKKILLQDPMPYLYFYRQTMQGKSQVGIVCTASVEDYFHDVIKKHEFTRPVKEQDRIRHMAELGAHVGPVFTTYRRVEEIEEIVSREIQHDPEYDFTASDGVQHTFWVSSNGKLNENLISLFRQKVPVTYIADGHHRAASSAKVGRMFRDRNKNHTGGEDYNFFLSVLFPDDQLTIMDYNRVVTSLNGYTADALMKSLADKFDISVHRTGPYRPEKLHDFGVYLGGSWYKMTARTGLYDPDDLISVLDVSILTTHVLDPLLGIQDQRTDHRIDFIGGIRGLTELERRVDAGKAVIAFALHPVSIKQLMDIADSGNVMPPKSTWFEPKLRSGLVVHKFA